MAVLIKSNSNPKFGDLEPMGTIYYLDPFLGEIEPAFVIGLDQSELVGHTCITVVLIPKELRSKPIKELDPAHFRKIVFHVDKNLSISTVLTKPPTIYATTTKELTEWLKK